MLPSKGTSISTLERAESESAILPSELTEGPIFVSTAIAPYLLTISNYQGIAIAVPMTAPAAPPTVSPMLAITRLPTRSVPPAWTEDHQQPTVALPPQPIASRLHRAFPRSQAHGRHVTESSSRHGRRVRKNKQAVNCDRLYSGFGSCGLVAICRVSASPSLS